MLDEICYNAMTLRSTVKPLVKHDDTACYGYKGKYHLSFLRHPKTSVPIPFPRVCGNCEWYSVQENIEEEDNGTK